VQAESENREKFIPTHKSSSPLVLVKQLSCSPPKHTFLLSSLAPSAPERTYLPFALGRRPRRPLFQVLLQFPEARGYCRVIWSPITGAQRCFCWHLPLPRPNSLFPNSATPTSTDGINKSRESSTLRDLETSTVLGFSYRSASEHRVPHVPNFLPATTGSSASTQRFVVLRRDFSVLPLAVPPLER